MEKKMLIVVGIVLIIIIAIITNCSDNSRVKAGHEPKYCIKVVSYDSRKVTYWGLGYKIIRYIGVSQNEPYENNIGVKKGSWFMKYELPIDNKKTNKIKTDIKSLDDFYNTELTKANDIRNLGKEYNSFDAQKDNCFVIGAMVHNDNLYSEFMENYKSKISSFIRVAQNTVEGDLIIYDILYYKNTDKLYLVADNTRDKVSADQDRNIRLKEFQNISEYNFKNHLYWILYNEVVNDENFNTDNVFIITKIS